MAKSSKKRKAEAPRQTKKQLARGRKEARQNRIILLSVGGLVLLIVIILGIAIALEVFVKPSQAVAMVNGSKVRSDDYQALLTYRRYAQHQNIQSMQSSLQELNPDEEGADFLSSFYEQQITQLQSNLALLPQDVLDELIDDKLIEEKAAELGLTVTKDEITRQIDEDWQQALAPAPQVGITDTEELPTPTPIPQEQIDEIQKNWLADMGLTQSEFHKIVGRGLLSQKVQEALADQVETTGLVVHAQLIKTDTEDEAQVAKLRIEAGEDFAIVAQEVSTDTLTAADGGDLGWVTPGQLTFRYGEDLENEIFAMEVGQLALVPGDDSFYVIQILERDENGPLPEEVLSQRQSTALSDWLEEHKQSPDLEIERLLDPEDIPPDPFATDLGF